MDARGEPDSPSGWRVTAGLAVVLAFGLTAVLGSCFSLFVQPMQDDNGWSRADVALGLSATSIIAPLVAPLTGWILDRVPLRPFVLVGIVLQALNVMALGAVGGSPTTFYLTMGALIITGAGASYVVASKILQGWFDRYRGRAMGAMFACQGIGMMILPPVAQWMIVHVGWRQAFVALGLVMLVPTFVAALLLVFERVPSSRRESDARSTVRPDAAPLPTMLDLLRLRVWWFLAAWNALFAFAVGGISFQLAPLFADKGVSPGTIGLALSVGAAGRMIGDLMAGALVDRFEARFVAATTMLVPIAAFAMFGFGHGAVIALVAGFVLGLASGADGCLSSYLPQKYFHPDVYGQAFMTQALAGSIGSGFAPYLGALLFEKSGGYELPLAVGAVAFALASLAALGLPRVKSSTSASAPVGIASNELSEAGHALR